METIALEQTCSILSGYAFKSKEYVSKGIRIIRIANVQKGYIEDKLPCYYPCDNKQASSDYALVRDDLLVSLTGNVGRVGLMPDNLLPAALNQRVACLRVKEDSPLTKEFIYAVLNSDQFEQEAIESSNGVAQKNLSVNWLKQYQLPLIAKTEQASFCKRFSIIDSNCSRTRTITRKLDDLIKSRFVEMFGDLEPVFAIEDVCDVLSGFAFKSTHYVDEGIRIIRIANVQKGFIEDKTPCYYPITDQAAASTFALRKDDLLVSLTGNVGRVGVMTSDLLPAALNQRVACLRPNRDNTINMRYLFALLNLDEFEKAAIESSSGSAQKNLSVKWLKSHRIAVPPIALQQEFAAFVAQVDKLRFAAQQQIDKLETLKKSLMQEYFG